MLQPGLIMLIERCFDAILADGLRSQGFLVGNVVNF